jgi:hypothetical protein
MAKDEPIGKTTTLIKCDCVNAYQDERYGQGMRVHNLMKGEPKRGRCTICEKEHTWR